jgi:hypothetical protein
LISQTPVSTPTLTRVSPLWRVISVHNRRVVDPSLD